METKPLVISSDNQAFRTWLAVTNTQVQDVVRIQETHQLRNKPRQVIILVGDLNDMDWRLLVTAYLSGYTFKYMRDQHDWKARYFEMSEQFHALREQMDATRH